MTRLVLLLGKVYSRKFMVYVIGEATAFVLVWNQRLDGQWYTAITALLSIVYLFMEGIIDIRSVNISTPFFSMGNHEPDKAILPPPQASPGPAPAPPPGPQP